MTSTRALQILALAVSTAFFSFGDLAAQRGGRPGGGGTGRPSFPPGLHDRGGLPPGRPFSPPDNFNPPGRASFTGEDADDMADALRRLMDDPSFPDDGTLPRAVDAYNYLVLALRGGDDAVPPPVLIEADQVLPRALQQMGLMAGGGGGEGGEPLPAIDEFQLLPGGTWNPQMALRPWAIPGMSAGTPIGAGADWGTVFAGVNYQNQLRYTDADDGAVAVGFGIGDAERYVGLQVGLISFTTVRNGLGERIGIDLHLHRRIGDMWSVAVGAESLGAPGDYSDRDDAFLTDGGESFYAVGSRWLKLRDNADAPFGLAMVSLGVGNGRFQSEDDFYAGEDGVGVFGSVGVRVLRPVSVIAEWTGQDMTLAASVTPFRNQNVAITAGFADVTGSAGDGARFVIGGGVGLNFR